MSGYRVGSVLLVVGLCGAVAAEAQGREFPFHYAVKLVCGIQRERGGVVPQNYATTINIHNPSDSVAQFVKS